jgi:hypothetical protein
MQAHGKVQASENHPHLGTLTMKTTEESGAETCILLTFKKQIWTYLKAILIERILTNKEVYQLWVEGKA